MRQVKPPDTNSNTQLAVIPAKAGIHNSQGMQLWNVWIPAFAGMTI